jgi:predicted P-loop ATPase
MSSHKYTISFFDNNRDNFPRQEDLTFEDLKIRLNEAARKKYSGKNELEAMICGKFIKNKRMAKYLAFRTIITYDIDNYRYNLKDLLNDCISCLGNIRYLYYTTISNTYSNPRIRILIFPDVNIPTTNYSTICEKLAIDIFSESILQAIDKASYSPMQLMYVPAAAANDYKCYSNNGNVISIEKYLNVKNTKHSANNFLADYKNLPLQNFDETKIWHILDQYDVEETDYHEWFKVCQALHHQYSGNEKGLEIFITWSLRDSRESKEDIEKHAAYKYKTIRSECENPVSFASIIKLVNDKKKLPATGIDRNFSALDMNEFIDVKYNKKFEVVGIKSTYKNFEIMCRHYAIKISYDIISKEIVNSLNEKNQNSFVGIIQSAMILNNMERALGLTYINLMAETNKINSFKNIMDNVIWDGADRLNAFYDTITVEDSYKQTRNLYLLKWLQQMLYLTLHDGPRKIARNLLVLQSKQYCGKSTWIKSLLPAYLGDYIGEGLHLDIGDSMSVLSCIKKIFVELGELEQSFKATDINQFKAFFGRTKDELNIKYLACPVSYTRTTSFLGTINEISFLKDKSGNTRFLVLPIQNADGFHDIDMLQLYRQIIDSMGYINFELTDDEREQQRIINEEFQQPDLIEEQFINIYETEFETGGTYHSCTEILEQIGYSKRDINHTRRCDIANSLRKYNFKYRKNNKKWCVKLKKENENDY